MRPRGRHDDLPLGRPVDSADRADRVRDRPAVKRVDVDDLDESVLVHVVLEQGERLAIRRPRDAVEGRGPTAEQKAPSAVERSQLDDLFQVPDRPTTFY